MNSPNNKELESMKIKNAKRRNNKKTIRSELVKLLVWTSILTMLVVGGGLSIIIFRWSSIALREDMDFYMESIQQQFTNYLLFWEESVIYLSENEKMNTFSEQVQLMESSQPWSKVLTCFQIRIWYRIHFLL